MGSTTAIPWTDATFNPWHGCAKVSPACAHCYAESLAKRWGYGDCWATEKRRFFGAAHWREPVKWNAEAAKSGVRRRVFCGSMCDVFERPDHHVPLALMDRARNDLWMLIEDTPELDWLLLTKRPENIAGMVPARWLSRDDWPRNVWPGFTAEDQTRWNERCALMCNVPARTIFASVEPMLGPIALTCIGCGGTVNDHAAGDGGGCSGWFPSWIICGGESGPGFRTMHPDWARSLRDQCVEAHVPYFFKQWSGVNPRKLGHELDGRNWREIPR